MNALTSVTEKLSNTLTNIVHKFKGNGAGGGGGGGGPPPPNQNNHSMLNNSLNNSFDDSYINYGFSSAGRGGVLHQRYAAALMHNSGADLLTPTQNTNNQNNSLVYGSRLPNFQNRRTPLGQ